MWPKVLAILAAAGTATYRYLFDRTRDAGIAADTEFQAVNLVRDEVIERAFERVVRQAGCKCGEFHALGSGASSAAKSLAERAGLNR